MRVGYIRQGQARLLEFFEFLNSRLAVLCALCVLCGSIIQAQPTPTQVRRPETATTPAPVVPNRGVHDRAEVEAFLDGVMAANLRDKHVAGATVAVVKDGALLFAK